MTYRALITGVAGFAGGLLAEHLLASGDEVIGCSQLGAWEATSVAELRGKVTLLPWDLAGGMPAATRREIDAFRPDVIYHLAALSVPGDCGEQGPAATAMAVNVGGTQRVLQFAASCAWRPRVLFTSTSHVYAPVTHEAPLVDESAPLGPRRGYGRSKLLAEAEVARAIAQDGCDALIARSFQHTGPRQNPRMMLPEWVRQFVVGPAPVVVQTRDAWIDVSDGRDIVRAYRLLVEHGACGGVYNVGSGMARRSGDVLEILRAMADGTRQIIARDSGTKQDAIADTSRLVACTGWQPTIPLETTIADTLAWWRQVMAE